MPKKSNKGKGAEMAARMGYGPGAENDMLKQFEAMQAGAAVDMQQLAQKTAKLMSDDWEPGEEDDEDADLLAELAEMQGDSDDEGVVEQPEEPKSSQARQQPVTAPTKLMDIQGIIRQRIALYTQAIAEAKEENEGSKARRYGRALQLLQTQAKSPGGVKEEDLAPEPPVKKRPHAPTAANESNSATTSKVLRQDAHEPPEPVKQPQEPPPGPVMSSVTKELLQTRLREYKEAAIKAKHASDIDAAKCFYLISKRIDAALTENSPIQDDDIPPVPDISAYSSSTSTENESGMEHSANAHEGEESSAEDRQRLFNAPDTPTTMLEALQQRMDKYQGAVDGANAEGNSSKARRHGRIVTQYKDAIKAFKAGRPLDLDSLPTPPGFPPFPDEHAAPAPPARTQAPAVLPQAASAAKPSPASTSHQPQQIPGSHGKAAAPRPPAPAPQAATGPTAGMSARQEKQYKVLVQRQAQFKHLALEAKKQGNIPLAKQHLVSSKGIDQLLEATIAGRIVNMASVPALPKAEDSGFEVVSSADVASAKQSTDNCLELERTLLGQIETAKSYSSDYRLLGDIVTSDKFAKMAENSAKDLSVLRACIKTGSPLPKFHVETRQFVLVRSNPEVGDNEMEIGIVRAMQLPLPDGYKAEDLKTFCRFEFPYPSEQHQFGETDAQEGTDPEYMFKSKVDINRRARSFASTLRRRPLKIEIFYKRGFFKSDKLLGTVTASLEKLENAATVNECFDLQDGRRAVGGKLELKVKIRDPIVGKRVVEQVQERWLVIDGLL